MLKTWVLYFALLSKLFVVSCQLLGEDDFPSDWVNPSDMMNFKYPSRQASQEHVVENVLEELHQEDWEEQETPDTIEDDGADTSTGTESDGAGLKVDGDNANLSQSCKNPMLKRFVSVLNGRLHSVGEAVEVERYEMSLKINAHMKSALQEYSQSCDRNVNEILEILEKMIDSVRVEYKIPLKRKFEDLIGFHFQDFLQIAFAVFVLFSILTLEVVSRVSWMTQLKRLFVIGIVVSIGMTYQHEIKVAEAEFKAKSHTLPKECMKDLEEISYLSALKMIYSDWFSTKTATDHCKEYHEAFLIHPKLKVTPTKVIAITFTRFALEPMEHMGIAFSKAFKNMFAGLPITLWLPGFIFVILIILGFMLLIAVLFGYNFSISLPFWAGLQIAPPQQALLHNPNNERLQDEVMQLRNRIEDLQNRPQQQALPPPAYPGSRRHNEILPQFLEPPGYGSNLETTPYPDPDPFASGDAYNDRNYQPDTGLRRRHTCSTDRRRANEDHTLPYPDVEVEASPMERVPRSTSDPPRMREGIGFEPLVRGLTEAQMDETPGLLAKQRLGTRKGNTDVSTHHKKLNKTINADQIFHPKKANEMKEKVQSAINRDLNNVSTYMKSDGENAGGVNDDESKDNNWVQIESVGAQSETVPSHSEPSLNQFAKEAEAGFNLDSLK